METYLELGLKPCQIARKLGVHKSTFSRELSVVMTLTLQKQHKHTMNNWRSRREENRVRLL
ncbi:hypothetical protein O3643_07885 [Streptococcus sp. 20925_1_44]|nr:hypothetical protein [Streptococcus sp. 9.1(2021)]